MTKFGKPALEQARDAVDLGHDHVCRVVPLGQVGDDVAGRVAADVVVALPGVGVDLGATLEERRDRLQRLRIQRPLHPRQPGHLEQLHEVPPPRRHVSVTTGPCAANGR
jgi:hypothetical protein